MKEYVICFQFAKNIASSIIQVVYHLGMYSIVPLSYSAPITPSLTETPDTKREQTWFGTAAEIIGEASTMIYYTTQN